MSHVDVAAPTSWAADDRRDFGSAEVQCEREIEEQEWSRRTSASTRALSVPRQLEAGIRRLELGPPAEPGRRDEHARATEHAETASEEPQRRAKKVDEGPADEPRDYTRAVTRLMMDQMVEHQEPQ